nr:class A beta-lactamase [Tomitella gaofuii]
MRASAGAGTLLAMDGKGRLGLCASLAVSAALLVGCGAQETPTQERTPGPAAAAAAAAEQQDPAAEFGALERKYGARLGVYAVDTGTGQVVGHRVDERFAYASTYKALLAGAVLAGASDEDLAQTARYTDADLLDYAPVTSQHVATGMTVRDLVAAMLTQSDNTAANLLLERLGGPAELQRRLRARGDATTNVDRIEPALNSAVPGDVRDTSTPRVLAEDLRGFALGDWLAPQRRARYVEWMVANTTGDEYIRAGIPAGWTVADKTGAGHYGTRNDIAVVWPDRGAPIVLAVLSDRQQDRDAQSQDALIADATAAVVAAMR